MTSILYLDNKLFIDGYITLNWKSETIALENRKTDNVLIGVINKYHCVASLKENIGIIIYQLLRIVN